MHLTLSPGRTARKAAAAHARSASQPCSKHSHPTLTRLDAAVRSLRSWSASASGTTPSSSSSFEGLTRLDAALAALGDLLATPRAAAALRGAGADRIPDAFLALADAYGTFGTTLLAARQSAVEARAGVRRGDSAVAAASARALRRAAKDLCRLAATMRHASSTVTSWSAADAEADAEVVGMVTEVAEAAAEASGAIVLRCAAVSPDMSGIVHTVSSHHRWLERLGVVHEARKVTPEAAAEALERLEEMEDCISGLETASDKVFRRLLQTRVLLLNIHNPL